MTPPNSFAQSADESEARESAGDSVIENADEALKWIYQCTSRKNFCWLEKRVPYITEAGDDAGNEIGGVAVAYDNLNDKPKFIMFWVPKDVSPDGNVVIRFLDSVKKDGKWKMEPRTGFLSLPVTECDDENCISKVYTDIEIDDSSSVNLFEQLKARNLLWVAFKHAGQSESYMVPVSGINEALEAIHADNK